MQEQHSSMLAKSGVSETIMVTRGYESLSWGPGDYADRTRLREAGITSEARNKKEGTGLLIPVHNPLGEQVSIQWRPDFEVVLSDGKTAKYLHPKGSGNHLDVHPLNVPHVQDPSKPLIVTEGIKKADCLASLGHLVVGLSGVWNWRSKNGPLEEWDMIDLNGRKVVIVFDSDGADNQNVSDAMQKLREFLGTRGASEIIGKFVPREYNGVPTKGIDDYIMAGGTWDSFMTEAVQPKMSVDKDNFDDSHIAGVVANNIFQGKFCYTSSTGWMEYTGKVWKEVDDSVPTECLRNYLIEQFTKAAAEWGKNPTDANTRRKKGWQRTLAASANAAILKLCRGIDGIYKEYEDFDKNPDVLNCQNGLLNLETGELLPHHPDQMVTKICKVDFEKGFKHKDWDKALEAIPEDVLDWAQTRYGQGITGHMPGDDKMMIEFGRGSNGKSTIVDGFSGALGDYYRLVSNKILLANDKDTPTEFMDLKGLRFAQLEETPEARRLDVNKMKQTVGTSQITARPLYKKSVTFETTHTMFITTNNIPVVTETDDASWRRLILFKFPYSFRPKASDIKTEFDRLGEEGLKQRVKQDKDIHKAALAWLVEGAMNWYNAGRIMPSLPERIEKDTNEWRASSDLVMSFLQERMVFDSEACVPTRDVLIEVNEWLEATGHRRWNSETLASKFTNHYLFVQNNVKKQKVRASKVTSRRQFHETDDLGVTPQVFSGLRFRTKADDVNGEEV